MGSAKANSPGGRTSDDEVAVAPPEAVARLDGGALPPAAGLTPLTEDVASAGGVTMRGGGEDVEPGELDQDGVVGQGAADLLGGDPGIVAGSLAQLPRQLPLARVEPGDVLESGRFLAWPGAGEAPAAGASCSPDLRCGGDAGEA